MYIHINFMYIYICIYVCIIVYIYIGNIMGMLYMNITSNVDFWGFDRISWGLTLW